MILTIKNINKAKDQKILRAKATELKFPLPADIKKLFGNMFETVLDASGVGLAAPQVGIGSRLIVVNLEHLGIPMFALVNPIITKFSRLKTEVEEGCLSIPGVYGIVERPEKINFEGYFPNGQKIKADAEGLLGRVIQHEIDHLDGVLITDKIKKYIQKDKQSK